MTALNAAVSTLPGVGPKKAEALGRLDISTLTDVLFHLPSRYEDRTRITPIAKLIHGVDGQIEGRVTDVRIAFGRRRTMLCTLQDDSATMVLRFFHFSKKQEQLLRRANWLRCYGNARIGRLGQIEMVHPEYQLISEPGVLAMTEGLTAVYPATEGIGQHLLRQLSTAALNVLNKGGTLPELLPESLGEKFDLAPMADAINYIHRPPENADLEKLIDGDHPMLQRLIFEELLAHHLSLRQRRKLREGYQAPQIPANSERFRKMIAALPFSLTQAQQRVIDEIAKDCSSALPMQRLLQGDVGSGKTVVAAAVLANAVAVGEQCVLMVPTEILSEQHYRCLLEWFEPLGVCVAWLHGRVKGTQRKKLLAALAGGDIDILVGTHAVFQDEVIYKKLGLVIIDEQHRFGVPQRLALQRKGENENSRPHQLIMTATPIPRSLAMTFYADLDLSVIDELPPGRQLITTTVISRQRRNDVVERIRHACLEGRQVYWVCTLIDESNLIVSQAATDTAAELTEQLSGIRIGLVHGRMKGDEKAQQMAAFKAGEIDLLVATTVIEVGVDVPNASLMIIENAERLGLSQLHQLRGRVGRGEQKSHCVLMYHGTLSHNARSRLAIMRETNDGFAIAHKDLELRGPGELLGVRQTGDMRLRVARLDAGEAMLDDIRSVADELLASNPVVVAQLLQRWLGRAQDFATV